MNNKYYKQKAREAFWGSELSYIISQEFPNGCTLEEAINYFLEHGEELEALGLI